MNVCDYEKSIGALREEIDMYRPFSPELLKNLQSWFRVGFTTHSNALEGNSFTLEEVRVLIEDGITVGGKTIREMRETENLARLTETIWWFFTRYEMLTHEAIWDMHRSLLVNIESTRLGSYRDIPVFISWSDEKLPASTDVYDLMTWLLAIANAPSDNTTKKIARIHYDFVKIHPFVDGNGRIARLLINISLVHAGFLPIIFPIVTRLDYIRSLWPDKTFDDFYEYFLWQLHTNLTDYLRFFKN